MALALIGISFSGAQAQTKNQDTKQPCKCAELAKKDKDAKKPHGHWHHSTTGSADVYQVCTEKNGHYDCCMHHKRL